MVYLRELRRWLRFSESRVIRKVFSATSLAWRKKKRCVHQLMCSEQMDVQWWYVVICKLYLGGAAGAGETFDSWKNGLNRGGINLRQKSEIQNTKNLRELRDGRLSSLLLYSVDLGRTHGWCHLGWAIGRTSVSMTIFVSQNHENKLIKLKQLLCCKSWRVSKCCVRAQEWSFRNVHTSSGLRGGVGIPQGVCALQNGYAAPSSAVR